MRVYRLGTAEHPVWDGSGAALHGGRWNPPGTPVIYAAGSLALAMLERLVQRRVLGNTLLVEAVIPDDLAWTDLLATPPTGWRSLGSPEAVAAGQAWLQEGRTAVLRVPSALVPQEPNWVINVRHQDAGRIQAGKPEPLEWDPRLFGSPAPSGTGNLRLSMKRLKGGATARTGKGRSSSPLRPGSVRQPLPPSPAR